MSVNEMKQLKQEIEETFLSYLPEEYQRGTVKIEEVYKTNEKKTGITITGISKIMPVLYVEDFMQNQLCTDPQKLLQRMAHSYIEAMEQKPTISENPNFNKEYVLKHVQGHLLNAEKNKELLQTVPHSRVLDLAIIPKLHFKENENLTILLTKGLTEKIGVSEWELLKAAKENVVKNKRPSVTTLVDAVSELLEIENPQNLISEDDFFPIYVVTTKDNVNGAIYMTDQTFMKKVANMLQTNFYILPGSIHEFLIAPEHVEINCRDLQAMVKEVNATGVEPSEQLSDHVYHFDAKTLELSIPATQEHQKLESFDTTNAITKKRESKSR